MSNVEMEVKTPLNEGADDVSPSKVKFISSSDDDKNGEAKVDIKGFDPTRTGLSKDELMKFANDPFWIKVRLISFILFWIAWLATLLGAVGIILVSPKCVDSSVDQLNTTALPLTTLNAVTGASEAMKMVITAATT